VRGARVATARGAAARLDPLAIRNAALAFCLPPTRAEEICLAFDLRAHWMRSLASAAAAEAIAQRFQVLDPDEAFTLGLLGRVGMLAMATLHPTEFAAILGEAEAGPPGALEAVETRVLQIDHWQAGADLMEAWGLPPHYRDAVAALSRSAAGQATELRVAGSQSLLGLALRMGDGIVRGARGAPADPLVHPAPELRAAHEEAEQQFRELVELCGLGPADGRETEPREPETGLSAKRIPSPPAPAPGASERIAVERTPTRILVVDDDPGARHLLGLHLRRAGYDVISAGDGRAGLAAAFSDAPLMVITDWLMPGLSGLELCQALRKTEAGRRMYLVVLTSREEEDSVVEGLEAGANDYLTKPFNARILLARVQAGERVIELQRQVDLDKLIDRKRVAQMAQLTRRLRSAALLDPLTGLHNRRSAMSTLEDAWSASSRPGGHLSVVMVDIDNFKRVNDEHGHQTGDAVLRAIAEILRNTCRRGDTVCRLGGRSSSSSTRAAV
jgi:CheY-like chemotaxis protein